MPRFFVKKEQESEKEINIIGEDIIHIKNVLRKQVGDILEICNEDTGNVLHPFDSFKSLDRQQYLHEGK